MIELAASTDESKSKVLNELHKARRPRIQRPKNMTERDKLCVSIANFLEVPVKYF